MKNLIVTPNGSQEFAYGNNPLTSFISYDKDNIIVDVECAGDNLATAYVLPSFSHVDNGPSSFNLHVTARFKDLFNRCIVLPNHILPKPHKIEIFAYIHSSIPSPLPNITVFLPLIQGAQSKFYDGTTSINIDLGRSMTFSLLGFNLATPSTPRLWTHS